MRMMGKALKYGDNVNTDVIIPVLFSKSRFGILDNGMRIKEVCDSKFGRSVAKPFIRCYMTEPKARQGNEVAEEFGGEPSNFYSIITL